MLAALALLASIATSAPVLTSLERPRVAILPQNPVVADVDADFRLMWNSDESTHAAYVQKLTGPSQIDRLLVDTNLEPARPTDVFSFAVLDSSSAASASSSDNLLLALEAVKSDLSSMAFIVHLGVPAKIPETGQIYNAIEEIAGTVPYEVTPAHEDEGQMESVGEFWSMVPPGSAPNFSFNYGSLHVVMLDSRPADPDEQMSWLVRDLLATNRSKIPWIIVAAAGDMSAFLSDELMAEYCDIFTAHKVDALFIDPTDAIRKTVTVYGKTEMRVENDTLDAKDTALVFQRTY